MSKRDGRTTIAAPFQVSDAHDGAFYFRSDIGGQMVEYRYEPRCAVCRAPQEMLLEIHGHAVQRTAVARIYRMLGQSYGSDQIPFSERALRRHLNQHVRGYETFDLALRSASAAFGAMGDPDRVTDKLAMQTLMERAYAALVGGQMELKASDLVAASRFMREIEEASADQGDAVFMSEAMSIILTEARKAMGNERFTSMMYGLRSNPRMVRLVRSAAGRMDDDDDEIQEAVVVDEVPAIEAAQPDPPLSDLELLRTL